MWIVYNILFGIGYVLMLPRFLFRMWRRGGYRKGFMQRFGVYGGAVRSALESRRRVWIHAVSVGETYVALRFMEAWRRDDPGVAFVLTVNTSTGHRVAAKGLTAADVLLYAVADFPPIVHRVLDRIRPTALVLTESEIWPNLIRMASGRGIPVALINGRLSASSTRGYRALRVFFRPIFQAFDLMVMQSTSERDRALAVGARSDRVRVAGSAKYDIARTDVSGRESARRVLSAAGFDAADPLILGGSTWRGEERMLMEALNRLRIRHRRLRLILVPRHAERRAEVESEIARMELKHVRRSTIATGAAPPPERVDVLLVDTTGELADFYTCATAVFVGKSLTEHGGQNLIEPAALGQAVVVGPNMENFADVTAELLAARAIIQVRDAAELEQALDSLLSNRDLREGYGTRAAEAVKSRRGAVGRSVEWLLPLLMRTGGDGSLEHPEAR